MPLEQKPHIKQALLAHGQCNCGGFAFAIKVPALWAWHDHSLATQAAHGAAYVTYVGSWKSRFEIILGQEELACFTSLDSQSERNFCKLCGTHVFYVRSHAPKVVNIPRALFRDGTGREPLYHVNFDERPDWSYREQPLRPLKGFPGVIWEGARRKRL